MRKFVQLLAYLIPKKKKKKKIITKMIDKTKLLHGENYLGHE
jgi:hypothetical protein